MITTTRTIRPIPGKANYEMVTIQIADKRIMFFDKQILTRPDVVHLVNRATWNIIKIWEGNKCSQAYQWVSEEMDQDNVFKDMTFFDLKHGTLLWEVGTPEDRFLRAQTNEDNQIAFYIDDRSGGIRLHKAVYTVHRTDHAGIHVINHSTDGQISIKRWHAFKVINEELLTKCLTHNLKVS